MVVKLGLLGSIKNAVKSKGLGELHDAVVQVWNLRDGSPFSEDEQEEAESPEKLFPVTPGPLPAGSVEAPTPEPAPTPVPEPKASEPQKCGSEPLKSASSDGEKSSSKSMALTSSSKSTGSKAMSTSSQAAAGVATPPGTASSSVAADTVLTLTADTVSAVAESSLAVVPASKAAARKIQNKPIAATGSVQPSADTPSTENLPDTTTLDTAMASASSSVPQIWEGWEVALKSAVRNSFQGIGRNDKLWSEDGEDVDEDVHDETRQDESVTAGAEQHTLTLTSNKLSQQDLELLEQLDAVNGMPWSKAEVRPNRSSVIERSEDELMMVLCPALNKMCTTDAVRDYIDPCFEVYNYLVHQLDVLGGWMEGKKEPKATQKEPKASAIRFGIERPMRGTR